MSANIRDYVTCPDCGKRLYHSRKAAKAASRLTRQRSYAHKPSAMREYLCPVNDGWHIGHLPTVVRRGRMSATDVYARSAS